MKIQQKYAAGRVLRDNEKNTNFWFRFWSEKNIFRYI